MNAQLCSFDDIQIEEVYLDEDIFLAEIATLDTPEWEAAMDAEIYRRLNEVE